MAIVYATKTGNWSDTTVWNTGALPTSADDVYSNTFTVTIDTSPTVLRISNASAAGVTAGGTFNITASGITLTCTGTGIVNGHSTTCCTFSASNGTLTINSNISAGAATGFVFSGGGSTCYVNGNVLGGTSNATHGISHSSGTLYITGNITGVGALGGSTALSTSGVSIINGIVSGGTGTQSYGITNSGTCTVTGTVQGSSGFLSYGINNNGTCTITGTIQASSGSSAWGIVNTGTLTHIGTAQASATNAAIGPGSVAQVTILTGPLLSYTINDPSAGVNPCLALRWFPADTALGTFEYRMRGTTASGSPSVRPTRQMFLTDAYTTTYPSTSIVRSGVSYGPGSIYSGIAAIPPRESVSFGVPVDNTTGTSAFLVSDIWNYPISGITTSGSIGERLKTAATVNVMGQLISDSFSAS